MKEQIQLSDHFTYGRLIRFTMPSKYKKSPNSLRTFGDHYLC